MRLTKRQLKRIIREEKQKLQELDFSGPAQGSDAEAQLEEAVLNLKQQLMSLDVGYSEEEAFEAILSEVEEILIQHEISSRKPIKLPDGTVVQAKGGPR